MKSRKCAKSMFSGMLRSLTEFLDPILVHALNNMKMLKLILLSILVLATSLTQTEVGTSEAVSVRRHTTDIRANNQDVAQSAHWAINIVTIACGKQHDALIKGFVFSVVKSHATALDRVNLYLILDRLGRKHIDSCLEILRRIIQITVINLEDIRTDELLTYQESRFSCGYYKLNMHNILPKSVPLVLFADIDVVINRNTSELLQQHHELVAKDAKQIMWAAMELADNQACCPQCVKKHNWPAGGCGINTGVMVMNLQRMRELNITVQEYLRTNDEPFVVAGDQDIINTHGYYHPELYSTIPCEWNYRAHAVCEGFDYGNAAAVHGVSGAFLKKLWYVPYEANQVAIKVCANSSSYQNGVYYPTPILWP